MTAQKLHHSRSHYHKHSHGDDLPQSQQHHDYSHDLADADGQIGGYFFHHHTHTHNETQPHDARLSAILQSDLYRYEIHELDAARKRYKETAEQLAAAQPLYAAAIAAQRTHAAAQLAAAQLARKESQAYARQLASCYDAQTDKLAAASKSIYGLISANTDAAGQADADANSYGSTIAHLRQQLARYAADTDGCVCGLLDHANSQRTELEQQLVATEEKLACRDADYDLCSDSRNSLLRHIQNMETDADAAAAASAAARAQRDAATDETHNSREVIASLRQQLESAQLAAKANAREAREARQAAAGAAEDLILIKRSIRSAQMHTEDLEKKLS